ncbi:hypothetical protein AKJ16_DCAP10004 [Drosera capensis]
MGSGRLLCRAGMGRGGAALKAVVRCSSCSNVEWAGEKGSIPAAKVLRAAAPVQVRVAGAAGAIDLKGTWIHQMLDIARVVVDCRFFALFGVAGSLLGSILCFVEGCYMIIKSYIQYFQSMSQRSDQAFIIHQIVEGIGTATVIFGMGLYSMFIGIKSTNPKYPELPVSQLGGLFPLKTLPPWLKMQSVAHAKSRIGHAVVLILQVGILEKIKSIPMASSLDLACVAAAVLVSSASVFLLSRLSAPANI